MTLATGAAPLLVLVAPQDIVNIASAVRLAKNFALGGIRLVRPEVFDPWRIEGIAHNTAETAWKVAIAALNDKAARVDQDNVDWYAAVTRKFAAGTPEGDLVRSNVPTTSRPEEPVQQAVISNLIVSGGNIHFDVHAPGATRYTYLQKLSGAAAFVVVLADSLETSFNLQGQPVGVHLFKAVPSNSRGDGPESAVVQVTVAAVQAA